MRSQLVVSIAVALAALSLTLHLSSCGEPRPRSAEPADDEASIAPRPAAAKLERSRVRMEFRVVDHSGPVAGLPLVVSGDEHECGVTTDADGAFSFVGGLADAYRLSVPTGSYLLPDGEAEGYCHDRSPVLLHVRRAAIATLVVPEEMAARGPHRVRLVSDAMWTQAREEWWLHGRRLRFTGLEPGDYRLIADDAEGVTVASTEFPLAPGDNGDVPLRAPD